VDSIAHTVAMKGWGTNVLKGARRYGFIQAEPEDAMEKTGLMYEKFLDEYVSDDAVLKYTTETAGYGITHLLRNEYARIYLNVVDSCLGASPARPLRLLEFGCGGGMNITRLISLLEEKKIPVEYAYGTDFSPRLVEAAGEEAKAFLPSHLATKLSFHVARNEKLMKDLVTGLGKCEDRLGPFDLIVGVNTFRYCHRLGKQLDCAEDIFRLLRPGGVCIIIDMNNRFPAFRSRFRDLDRNPDECYLPSLEEYTSPFETTGFEIIRKGNFCWIPHSAGHALTFCCRLLSSSLNLVARNRAMRSLVVARKPA
jgi:SAM-dependent methyltransferase